MLVYLRESSLRRKERGITTSLVTCQRRSERREEWDIYSHEGGDPEVSVQQIFGSRSVCEATNDAGHKITNNDEITNTNTEALDSDGSVEDDGSVGVCDLAQGEEARIAAIEVSGASCLKVETEA